MLSDAPSQGQEGPARPHFTQPVQWCLCLGMDQCQRLDASTHLLGELTFRASQDEPSLEKWQSERLVEYFLKDSICKGIET